MENLDEKVAVITGAGGGFGREFARLAAHHGMRLVLTDVQPDALAAIVNELRESGVAVIDQVIDVADGRQVAQLADRAFAEFGGVHLLMNNAGVGCGGYLWENSDRDWQWVMGVNLMGVVHGIRHFVPRMLAAEANGETGHIVNTASMAGWLAPPLMGVYNVSKHARRSAHRDAVSRPAARAVDTGGEPPVSGLCSNGNRAVASQSTSRAD